MVTIICVVEGSGEVTAVPLLLRNLLWGREVFDVQAAKPINAHGVGGLAKRLEHFLELAQRHPGCSAVLVVQDGEGSCPAELVREYVSRATEAGCKHPVAFVIANRMYESWLVASIGTIAGERGLPEDASFDDDPEELASPKAWLDSQMRPGRGYKETTDQAAMTARLDPALARQCRSFRRLEAALDFLLDCIRTGKAGVDPAA